ncbi:hypothetical protein NDU88_002449 [Pleurodeles waltl]|uniref:Uncharacterized protein n=1 Tax=Pleurodeles waltl TaxID=8319 RepID=A0AAV7TKM2_PLEWA|nr:hypothetical protein NDU88_002449 [Pleurodeles waltl]
METPAGGEEDEDGPADGRQAGRQRGWEDQEAILQDPGHALGGAWPPQVVVFTLWATRQGVGKTNTLKCSLENIPPYYSYSKLQEEQA